LEAIGAEGDGAEGGYGGFAEEVDGEGRKGHRELGKRG